jgi:nicotinate-nucleotide adenylyltransferase
VRLGVLGGTFDPPHTGHLVLAEQAREQLDLERVLWMPAGEPWRKPERPVSAAEHRLAMVQLAVEGHQAFEVSAMEIEREGPSYSVDTLAALREQRPRSELFLIVGADALRDLPNWREPERILWLATIAVAAREGERPAPGELERPVAGLSERVVWVDMPRIDISASDLRRRAREGRSLRFLVPDAVEAYIREHRLYQEA